MMQNANVSLQRQSLYAVSSHRGLAKCNCLIFTYSQLVRTRKMHLVSLPDSLTYKHQTEEHS